MRLGVQIKQDVMSKNARTMYKLTVVLTIAHIPVLRSTHQKWTHRVKFSDNLQYTQSHQTAYAYLGPETDLHIP